MVIWKSSFEIVERVLGVAGTGIEPLVGRSRVPYGPSSSGLRVCFAVTDERSRAQRPESHRLLELMRPATFCYSTLQQRLRQESNPTNELRRLVPGIRQDEGSGLPVRSRTWHKCFRRTPPGIRQDEEKNRHSHIEEKGGLEPHTRRVRPAFEAVLALPSQRLQRPAHETP